MYVASAVHQTARLTFGRETAQFKQLITLLAIISIMIWSIVLISLCTRVLYQMWYRHRYAAVRSNLPPQ